jgi:hypothetical protein
MSQNSSNDLSQELAVLSDVFSDLGERLLGVARQLHSPGAPPPEKLIEELGSSRRDFLALRDRATERAEALNVPFPKDETLDTIQGLTAILDMVAEAEIRQSKGEEVRRRAVAKLDRVLRLAHTADPAFAPLGEVHDKARGLRESIAQAHWSDLPVEAEPLSEGDHVFTSLLCLVEDRDALDDDAWSAMHDVVGSTFGKSLAAAAARSKLVLQPGPEGDTASPPAESIAPAGSENRPAAPSDKPAGGRRNLGKATPSSR